MALNFEFEKNITTKSQPFISYDTKSEIINYSIKGLSQIDSSGESKFGQYNDFVFSGEGHNITSKDVTRIGGKNIPGIGTVAFYKDAKTGNCYIVNVISYKNPELELIEYENNKLHIIINAPIDVYYSCYRLIMRQGDFAFECIINGTEDYIDMPLVKGDYEAYCFGYDEANGIVSPLSDVVNINIPYGLDNWEPESNKAEADLLKRIQNIEREINGVGNLVDTLNGEVI